MDTRYRERGYSANLVEGDHGAFLTIRRNGVIIGEVAVGIFTDDSNTAVQIDIKRFRPNELRKVMTHDDFDAD